MRAPAALLAFVLALPLSGCFTAVGGIAGGLSTARSGLPERPISLDALAALPPRTPVTLRTVEDVHYAALVRDLVLTPDSLRLPPSVRLARADIAGATAGPFLGGHDSTPLLMGLLLGAFFDGLIAITALR